MTQLRLAAGVAVLSGGQAWEPDAGQVVGGRAWTSTNPIAGTTTPELYQPERYGMSSYTVPVPAAGFYRVTLRMAEVYWKAAGKRVFSVAAQGSPVITDLDIFATVGANTALDRTFDVWVGRTLTLTLAFTAKVDYAKVSTVQVDSLEATFGTAMVTDPQSARGGPFGPTSIWQQDISTAPIAPDSAAQVADLAAQVASRYGGIAAFNSGAYGDAYYTVGPDQALVNVIWDDRQHKGFKIWAQDDQFSSVPIPADAVPSTGTDHYLSIYQPSTDKLWAYWLTQRQADGWHATWGGRIDNASTSWGGFWGGFGVSATGLAAQGGVVNIKDAQAGSINHALALQVVNAARGMWSKPAERSDGSGGSSILEGTRFRLDPTMDVDALKLHPLATMIAKAAQRYGFIVTDRSGCVAVVAEDGGPTQAFTGTNPWPAQLAGAQPYNVLHRFPWASLQALPRDYVKP